ncbi:MmgE/PrpD family protein [Sphingomonas desiccabilis]|uniref:MmgE/PrpD family protein n=1 Tax=Sphingomonas desiccabilis TaxID=429134 RepID=A0A4Q2IUD4_9SPHN|nr:MmgE/PrpD family protein [Sphingomonas desiccabilis]MBB3911189.1 2-methylcitrate dehydratase PrpD [Sphingomonas desiccabilis]RXZ32011.1 MmgE/PrpD family protein [Sphingomonas desiccabilis]
MTVSAQLAEHIASFAATDLPDTAITATARALLDGIGVMLAASGSSEDVQPFLRLAAAEPGPCTVLGTAIRSTPALAAAANGAMAHALDFGDTFDRGALHPHASAIPAALALTEARGGLDGRSLLAALAIGCDLTCRLGLALRQPMEQAGWYPPPLLGALGATATAARVIGLNADQVRAALSLTLCAVTAPGAIGSDPHSTLRATREAFAARAAVESVLLAEAGVRGFSDPIGGKGGFYALYAGGAFDPDDLFDTLGERFWGEALSFKPWPACRGTHAFIELALEALTAIPDLASIERIEVDVGEVQQMLVEPLAAKATPATAIAAKFSIPFTVALALQTGQVTLDDFGAESLADPAILMLSTRVVPRRRPDWGRDRATAGAMTIHLHGQAPWQGERLQPLGHPSNPLSSEALVEKFVACAAKASMPVADPRALADRLLSSAAAGTIASVFGD